MAVAAALFARATLVAAVEVAVSLVRAALVADTDVAALLAAAALVVDVETAAPLVGGMLAGAALPPQAANSMAAKSGPAKAVLSVDAFMRPTPYSE